MSIQTIFKSGVDTIFKTFKSVSHSGIYIQKIDTGFGSNTPDEEFSIPEVLILDHESKEVQRGNLDIKYRTDLVDIIFKSEHLPIIPKDGDEFIISSIKRKVSVPISSDPLGLTYTLTLKKMD